MKIVSFFIFIFMFPFASFTQSETMPVILVSADSKVEYKDKMKVNVIPGSVMDKSGTLTLTPAGRVIVYHNYMFVEVAGDKSPVALDKLFVPNEEMVSKSELSFGEKMSDAVYNAFISGIKMKNQKALVSGWGSKGGSGKDGWGSKGGSGKDGWGSKGGSGKDGWGSKGGSGKDGWGSKGGSGKDGWGSKGGSGKDGWGSKGGSGKDGWVSDDIKIRSASPGGKYVEGTNNVSWEPLSGTKSYVFVIEDMDHNIVFTKNVTGTTYSIDSREAKLTSGIDYAWYVHHPVKKEVSTPVFFTVVNKAEEETAINNITSSDLYKKANEHIRMLMEAHVMEDAGLLLAAQSRYLKVIELSPNNSLAKMMYAQFCNNMNEIESAVKALK
jgi:hypothetical protein